jgi:hypothetical protein
MNPLGWKLEQRIAGIVICLIGGTIGLLFAWFENPFYALCRASLSGEWANCSRVFFLWLPNVGLYWPWPMFGALILGLAFYVLQILRNTS